MVKGDELRSVVQELDKTEFAILVRVNTYEQLVKELSDKINFLIINNFSRLISILYRLDISEKKLKQFLAEAKNTNAGDIIAVMIIERQLQKIKSRAAFKTTGEIPEEDRW